MHCIRPKTRTKKKKVVKKVKFPYSKTCPTTPKESEIKSEAIDPMCPFYTCEVEMENRMKRAIDRFQSYSEPSNETDKESDGSLMAKLNKSCGPNWYQELSNYQIDAIDSLNDMLADDLQEGTIYRCLKVLRLIGILPIVNNVQIGYAIHLSRGNDIAFLWYLMRLFYDTSCPYNGIKKYTINERIIMSCICHLDMIPTLRELDKILPPPFKQKPSKKKCKKKINCIRNSCQCKFGSPYLEPLTRINIPPSKALPPPKLPPYNFAMYERYKDPKYDVHQLNRWYSDKSMKEKQKEAENVTFDRKEVLDYVCHKKKTLIQRKNKQLKLLFKNTRCHCIDHIHDSKYVVVKHRVLPRDLENAKTRLEYKKAAKLYRKQTLVRIIFRNIIQHLPEMENVKICSHCKDCINDYYLYLSLVRKNNCRDNLYSPKTTCGCFTKEEPSPTADCQYDYEKLFRDSIFMDPVKNASLFAKELDQYATEENSLTICLRYYWKLETPFWNEELFDISDDDYDVTECEELIEKKKKFVIKKPVRNDVEISSTHPNAMKILLKDAIRSMRKNTSFVLVTLPKVYKLKILEEWMLVRYGHEYTELYKANAIIEDKATWDSILKKHKNVTDIEIPKVIDICDSERVDFDYRNRIEKRVKYRMKEFQHELHSYLIDECRLYWPTMRPYLCPNNPRQVFYSYMPANEYDICSFKLWCPHEVNEIYKLRVRKNCRLL